jgi:O-antigen/teichoic acid export membrane protein
MHGYRPRPRLDRRQAAELFRFGRWVLGSAVVGFLTMHGDDAFLGKLLGAAALGAYQVAYQLANAPATEIAGLCRTVMMPAYAKVQHRRAGLRATFLEVFELVASAALPLAAFTWAAAPDLVIGLLGPKWEAAVAPVQVLCVAALLHVLTATGSPAFIGTGRPHMNFWMNVARLCVIVPTIYPLTLALRVTGTAMSVALGMAAAVPLWARVVPILHVRWRAMLNAAAPGLALGLLAAAGVTVGRLLPTTNVQLRLTAEIVAAGAFCTLATGVAARRFGRGPYVQGRKMLADLRGNRPPS